MNLRLSINPIRTLMQLLALLIVATTAMTAMTVLTTASASAVTITSYPSTQTVGGKTYDAYAGSVYYPGWVLSAKPFYTGATHKCNAGNTTCPYNYSIAGQSCSTDTVGTGTTITNTGGFSISPGSTSTMQLSPTVTAAKTALGLFGGSISYSGSKATYKESSNQYQTCTTSTETHGCNLDPGYSGKLVASVNNIQKRRVFYTDIYNTFGQKQSQEKSTVTTRIPSSSYYDCQAWRS